MPWQLHLATVSSSGLVVAFPLLGLFLPQIVVSRVDAAAGWCTVAVDLRALGLGVLARDVRTGTSVASLFEPGHTLFEELHDMGRLRVRSVSGSTHALCPAMLSSPRLRKHLLWSLLARRAQTTCPSLPLHILIFDSPGRTTQWSTAALSPGSSRGSLLSPPKRFAVFDLAYHFRILEFRVFPRHSLCCTPQSLVVAWSLSNTLCLRSWSARLECHLAPLPFRRLIMPLKHALRCAQRTTKSRDALPWSTLAKSRLSPMPPSYTQSFRPTLTGQCKVAQGPCNRVPSSFGPWTRMIYTLKIQPRLFPCSGPAGHTSALGSRATCRYRRSPPLLQRRLMKMRSCTGPSPVRRSQTQTRLRLLSSLNSKLRLTGGLFLTFAGYCRLHHSFLFRLSRHQPHLHRKF